MFPLVNLNKQLPAGKVYFICLSDQQIISNMFANDVMLELFPMLEKEDITKKILQSIGIFLFNMKK